MAMAMQVDRALVDKEFDRYLLAVDGISKHAAALSVAALAPLDAVQSLRKAQWESRVHHNALAADPFLGGSFGAGVAYFVDAEYQLVQVVDHTVDGLKLETIYSFPMLTGRQENVSVQVAGKGLLVYCDGHGMLHFLKAESDQKGAKWTVVYECAPWGVVPLLLLGAFYDEQHQHIHAVVAEPLAGNEADGAFRLSMVGVRTAVSGGGMEIDSGCVGLEHTTAGIAVVSELPTYVSFSGPEVVFLVEGTHQLLMELVAKKKAQTAAKEASAVAGKSSPHKRPHNEDDLDEDEMAVLLSKLPRAGIGFHGEITKPKEAGELASLDFKTPLSERFHKSSTPFSSVDVPLHGAPDISTRYRKESIGSSQDRPLEVPTAESILSGFEECDSGDPNAKAALLLVNFEQKVVQEQLDIDCMNFQFLAPSARVNGSSDFKSTLLFRNDVHGLIYELNVALARLTLRHATTLPAFGFVQASKQEKKFMSFHPSGSFACIGEFERRVFVYQGDGSEEERKTHTRKQHVVELGDQQLLGLQIVNDDTILVLTPTQIYSLGLPAQY
ncbi:mitochondrial inner membrane protein oxa1 [Phytophthora cinnamomi]|uniref:mitochondrial inner membrane protein oxa1 n=1 Tax=Phytophthora cinnamomi TaxID=4785 RepID=UPI00355A44D2|nr:mitochondrial inner membrane protein oxa1 [Phytophthora cinnamomi]